MSPIDYDGAVAAARGDDDSRHGSAEYLEVADDERMVVLGRYRGAARATGRPHDAGFAHVLRFGDGRVAELVQITDTHRWREALTPRRGGSE